MRRLIVAMLMLVAPAVVQAERRVALVIANADYRDVQPLKNPTSDARLVAAALKAAGFDSVDVRSDQDMAHFRQALRDFRGQADGADVALIYYAGHGIAEDGANWLIPTDAELASAPDVQYEAIDLELLMTTLAGARMRVAILDACRNNPFKGVGAAQRLTSGLAQVEVDDVLVIFSAAPGAQAQDGDGANSPFASALAKHLPEAGLPLQLMGGVVRDDVIAATANKQRPFISASVTGRPYYLVQGASPPPPPPPPTFSTQGGHIAVGRTPVAVMGKAGRERAFTNRTGETIVELHVAKAGSNNWDEDALGDRSIAAGDAANLTLDGGDRDCLYDVSAKLASGATVTVPRADVCANAAIVLAAQPSERWIARDPHLPMAQVDVARAIEGDSYRYTVTGTYPLTKRDGTPMPQARIIRIVPRLLREGFAVPVNRARQAKVGLWAPGAPFTTSFALPKTAVDSGVPFELRLCMGEDGEGEAGFCVWSPNLVKDGPQQLLPGRRAGASGGVPAATRGVVRRPGRP